MAAVIINITEFIAKGPVYKIVLKYQVKSHVSLLSMHVLILDVCINVFSQFF